jgi:hypothetical protein
LGQRKSHALTVVVVHTIGCLGRRATYHFSAETLEQIREVAADRGVTPGQIVREAIQGFLAAGLTVDGARTCALTVALPVELADELDEAAAAAGASRAVLWALERG